MAEIATEERYFREEEARLKARYSGKVVVIHGQRVVAVYERADIAEREALREFGRDAFLLKAIDPFY